MNDTTPLRRRAAASTERTDGVWVLAESGVRYVEQAELTVMEILQSADDVSSDSEELEAAGSGSAVTYHLSNRRPNVVRFLELPTDARVLEIGAGCGAVTRYLGERCATVDAVEPMLRRATVARERCRDLDKVEVFAGEVADVPAEPGYDVVLVNGVLEYVGSGAADHAAYAAFLRSIAERLLPGGVLVLAIENQLGVKYVVGSPEDHTDREFDSLEGYPRKNRARVFSRRELSQLLTDSGFEVDEALAAFPDYKRTAVLMSESLDSVDPSLAYRIPPFPSPDRRGFRHRVASEFAVWRTLVEAGLTWEFPNSFVMLAHVPGPRRELWPQGRHAVFARNQRRPAFALRTVLESAPDGAAFRRERHPRGGTEVDGVRLVASSAAYVPGKELLFELAEAPEARQRELLQSWAGLVDNASWDDGAPLDMLPHNMVLTADGGLVLIDDEYRARDWSRADVVHRGILTVALKLADITSAQRWDQRTVEELALHLGSMVGLAGGWLPGAVAKEAALRRTVRPPGAQNLEKDLQRTLGRALADGPMDLQAVRRVLRLDKQLASVQAELDKRTAELRAQREQLAAVQRQHARQLDRITSTKGYRALSGLRRVVTLVRRRLLRRSRSVA